jgi:hypothetical protein
MYSVVKDQDQSEIQTNQRSIKAANQDAILEALVLSMPLVILSNLNRVPVRSMERGGNATYGKEDLGDSVRRICETYPLPWQLSGR